MRGEKARGAVYPSTAPPRWRSVQPVIAASRLVRRRARGAQLRDVNWQVHRGQDFLGEVLGLDEGDQAELGLALGAENFDPERTAQKFGPRNIP